MTTASHGIVEFKAEEDGPKGLFAAKVSVIGNVDRNGDRLMPGSWDGTIERWKSSGKKIPVVWSHAHKDPNAYIGWVDPNDVRIVGNDVMMAGQLDIENNPIARQAYNLLKNGLVSDWSFAYEVLKEKIAADKARDVYDLDMFEVGPTLVGANGLTDTLAVASAPTETSITDPSLIMENTTTGNDNVTVTVATGATGPSKITTSVDDAMAKLDAELENLIESKIGRVISRRTEEKIRAAVAQLTTILSSLDEETLEAVSPSEEKAAEQPAPPSEDEIRRAEHRKMGLFLGERGR